MSSKFKNVSLSVFAIAAITEFKGGWLVSPAMELNAVSQISTPALAAAKTVTTPLPLVS